MAFSTHPKYRAWICRSYHNLVQPGTYDDTSGADNQYGTLVRMVRNSDDIRR